MIPRLGEKYDVEIETISRPLGEYNSHEYSQMNLPKAPAIIVEDEILIEGADIMEEKLESVICRNLDLPPPEPQKKGILGRFLRR